MCGYTTAFLCFLGGSKITEDDKLNRSLDAASAALLLAQRLNSTRSLKNRKSPDISPTSTPLRRKSFDGMHSFSLDTPGIIHFHTNP